MKKRKKKNGQSDFVAAPDKKKIQYFGCSMIIDTWSCPGIADD